VRTITLALAAALIFASCAKHAQSPSITVAPNAQNTVVAAYYADGMPVSKIPVYQLTDLIYAFGEPGSGNTCHQPGAKESATFAQLRALRAAHPNFRLLLSIGGWGEAPQYSDAALSPQSRHAFAQSCISAYVQNEGFDGIDLDWEFPVHGGVSQNPHRPQDRANATALIEELRTQLDALGAAHHRHYYLTAATPAGRWQTGGAYDPSDSYDFAAIAKNVDWLNVMTYDMSNIFSPVSNFNAPLREDPKDPTPALERRYGNVEGAVQYYEQHGVPASKIVLGVPFYGRGFVDVSSHDAGRYSKYKSGFDETPWSIVSTKFLPDAHWEKHWSDTAQAPWIYNARTKTFFSYDDPKSIGIKAAFIKRAHLRGAMFWVLGEDDGSGSLLHALSDPLLGSSATALQH
jgi:chitinase